MRLITLQTIGKENNDYTWHWKGAPGPEREVPTKYKRINPLLYVTLTFLVNDLGRT